MKNIFLLLVLIGLSNGYGLSPFSEDSELHKIFLETKPEFQRKVNLIYSSTWTTVSLANKQSTDEYGIYSNRLNQLSDGLVLALGYMNVQKDLEYMLYEQMEPQYDDIIKEFNLTSKSSA